MCICIVGDNYLHSYHYLNLNLKMKKIHAVECWYASA